MLQSNYKHAHFLKVWIGIGFETSNKYVDIHGNKDNLVPLLCFENSKKGVFRKVNHKTLLAEEDGDKISN